MPSSRTALIAFVFVFATFLLFNLQPTCADWGLVKVFDFSDGYPGSGADIGVSGTNPSIHDDIVMFGISGGGSQGIFRYERGSLLSFADNSSDDLFSSISVASSDAHNPWGGFVGNRGSGNGIYTRSINNMSSAFTIASPSTGIPSGSGNFTSFGDHSIDDSRVTFIGFGSSSQRGIYASAVNTSNDPSLVIERFSNLPGGSSDTFQSFTALDHENNTVVFSGSGSSNSGIYFRSISGFIVAYGTVADTNTNIPSRGSSKFTFLQDPSYDGTASAFHGFGSGVSGVYTNQGGPLRTVADTDTPIPGATGNFTSIASGSVVIDDGDIAFEGIGTGNLRGIYVERDGTLEKIVATGDVVDGRTVTGVSLGRDGFSNGHAAVRLNFDDFGATFYAAFSEHRWDPPVAGGGYWNSKTNWPLGALPGPSVPTFIQPDGPAVIQGPANTTHLRSLSFGSQNSGITELNIQPTGQLIIAEDLTIEPSAKLTGDGSVFVNDVVENSGEIDLGSNSLTLGGNQLNNLALLRGNGLVANQLTNFPFGEIRVEAGDTIRFTGSTNVNHGKIRLINGGITEFTGPMTNTSTGTITGRGAIIADAGLTNAGTMNFSGGFTDLYGDVTFTPGGNVRIAGGGTTTFYDDVVNDGQITVDDGSRAVFLGTTSGTGAFPGIGEVVVEGILSPGHSPGTMTFGGDLSFGPTSSLEIEIGGTDPGVNYDRVEVDGFADLMGTLDVTLIDGFSPMLGDSFGILFASGGFNSAFSTLNVPDISDLGLGWQLNPGGSTLFLEVVAGDLAGDFDFDGDVDGFDFLTWQRGDSPNSLSSEDLDKWQTNFGSNSSAVTAPSAVPEPTGFLLALSSAVIFCSYRRSSLGI